MNKFIEQMLGMWIFALYDWYMLVFYTKVYDEEMNATNLEVLQSFFWDKLNNNRNWYD